MEARIVQLPTTEIRVEADRIVIERLVVRDPALAVDPGRARAGGSAGARRAGPADRAARAPGRGRDRRRRRRSRRSSRSSCARPSRPTPARRRRWTRCSARTSPTATAGCRGRSSGSSAIGARCAAFVNELFDETKRDSAIGRMQTLLGTYFDGDASRARGPARPHPPALPDAPVPGRDHGQFDRLNERLTAIEAAAAARGAERARSAAKGARLRGPPRGDARRLRPRRRRPARPDRVGEAGEHAPLQEGRLRAHDRPRPDRRRGRPDRRRGQGPRDVGPRRSARSCARRRRTGRPRSRLAVFRPDHAPAGIAPFDVRAGDVYCVIDPANPDPATLDAALRLARLLAIASLRDVEPGDRRRGDPGGAWPAIRAELDALKGIKATLTSIANERGRASRCSLDRLRDAIVARVAEAEAEIRRPRRRALSGEPPRNEPAAGGLGTVGTGEPMPERDEFAAGGAPRLRRRLTVDVGSATTAVACSVNPSEPESLHAPPRSHVRGRRPAPRLGRGSRRGRRRAARCRRRHRRRRDDGRVSRPGRPDGPLDRPPTRAARTPRRRRDFGPGPAGRLPRRSHVHPRDPRLLGPADRAQVDRASTRPGGRRRSSPTSGSRSRARSIPTGISRIGARVSTAAKIDGIDDRVDADVAIVDTGIAKVPDLNVVGGHNCSTSTPTPLARRLRPRDARRGHGRRDRQRRRASSASRRASGSGPSRSSTTPATGC